MTPDGGAVRPEKIAPHSIQAEEAVLGSVLIAPECLFSLSFLSAADFFIVRNGWVWEALSAIQQRGEAIDLLTVKVELQVAGRLDSVGGSAYLTYLMNNTPTHLHAETYGRLVERAAIRRRLLAAASDIAQTALEENAEIAAVVDHCEAVLFGVTGAQGAQDLVPLRDLASALYDKTEYLYQNPDAIPGLPTGFKDLDGLLDGLQPQTLNILAARPGFGKTSLALNIAVVNARLGKRIAFFSMEMSREALTRRMAAADTGINTHKLRAGNLDEREWGLFTEATSRIATYPLFIDDTGTVTPLKIAAKCRRMAREQGLDLVVIDYLQLMARDGRSDGATNDLSSITRALKLLSGELRVPILALSQLSRAVEGRQDKHPMLSDLRQSGCLTGETKIYLPEDGRFVQISELVGKTPARVQSLNQTTWKLETAEAISAFPTGVKPVYKLSTKLHRQIRATANHQFLTLTGWKRLDDLTDNDHIAVPRRLDGPLRPTMTDEELALLGHLIGNGCVLPRHAIQYTTPDPALGQIVMALALQVFGGAVKPRLVTEKTYYQVYLPSSRRLTHGKRNPVSEWFTRLGVCGLRSYEKHVPDAVFAQPEVQIGVFLRHLWATDGSIRALANHHPSVFYASSSERLSRDVQTLLLRLGMNAVILQVRQGAKGRPQHVVEVSGASDLRLFAEKIGGIGAVREEGIAGILQYLDAHVANTNRDVISAEVWHSLILPAIDRSAMSRYEFQRTIGKTYSGPGLYRQNVSRQRLQRIADVLESPQIAELAQSDVYWDRVLSIEPDGEEQVFDLTVPRNANFVANNIIAHNSIEQDADVVMFIYREEMYNPASQRQGEADIIVAKQREGPTGTITLYFRKEITQFTEMERKTLNLTDWGGNGHSHAAPPERDEA